MSDFSIWGLGLAVVLLACVHLEQALAWRRIRKLQETAPRIASGGTDDVRLGRDQERNDTHHLAVPSGPDHRAVDTQSSRVRSGRDHRRADTQSPSVLPGPFRSKFKNIGEPNGTNQAESYDFRQA